MWGGPFLTVMPISALRIRGENAPPLGRLELEGDHTTYKVKETRRTKESLTCKRLREVGRQHL